MTEFFDKDRYFLLIEERIRILNGVIKQKKRALRKAPEGTLNISRSGGKVRYYRRFYEEGFREYIKDDQRDLARKLAQKAYDQKVMDLLIFARTLYATTQGRTNVAMGSVLSVWHDYRTAGLDDPSNASLPPMSALKVASEHTDIATVMLDEQTSTVFLSDPEMTLDVGAVAKGYATERIAQYLEQQGISGYLLNVGGNVRCIGGRPDGEKWAVGIENPNTEDTDNPYIAYLKLEDMSLVTSGSYQRYYTVNGKDYHHIIDPDTLMPGTEFRSVSVVCKDSGKADALSTALFTMNYERGSALIASLDGVEAMWVLPNGEQRYSDGFLDYTYQP